MRSDSKKIDGQENKKNMAWGEVQEDKKE